MIRRMTARAIYDELPGGDVVHKSEPADQKLTAVRCVITRGPPAQGEIRDDPLRCFALLQTYNP